MFRKELSNGDILLQTMPLKKVSSTQNLSTLFIEPDALLDYKKNQDKSFRSEKLKSFLDKAITLDQKIELFKKNFFDIYSINLISEIEILQKLINELEIDAANLVKLELIREEFYSHSFKKCLKLLADLIENQSTLSKNCYDQYVLPLVGEFWNVKYNAEKKYEAFINPSKIVAISENNIVQFEHLPYEIYVYLLDYIDPIERQKLRLVNKTFKKIIDGMDSFYFNARRFLRASMSVSDYRKLANSAYIAFDEKKITAEHYEQLSDLLNAQRIKLIEACQKSKITIPINMGLGIGSFAIATILFFHLYVWDKCFSSDIDIAACENDVSLRLQRDFFTLFLACAAGGFIGKTIIKGITFCINPEEFFFTDGDNSVLPKMPLNKPLTKTNQFIYLIWSAYQYRSLIPMAASIYLAVKLAELNPFNLDISPCLVNYIDSKGVDLNCLVNLTDGKEASTSNYTIANGFISAYSSLSTLMLLFKIIEKFSRPLKSAYRQYNFFAPKSSQPAFQLQNIIVDGKQEQEEEGADETPLIRKHP